MITENPCQGLITGVVDTGEHLIAGVICKYFREFLHKFEMTLIEYSGAGGTLIPEEKLRKSRVRLPFSSLFKTYIRILIFPDVH